MQAKCFPLAACLCALALGSCGGGKAQDENEPEGDFHLRVVKAEFPPDQKLAKKSTLRITVRNAETDRTVPNVAVTVHGFDTRVEDADLADPSRPVFAINGQPARIGTFPESKEQAPKGGETVYNGTWALGPLKPGRQKTFEWTVTAVRSGPYRISYEVAAGLDGKARAVGEGGRRVKGLFIGTIDGRAPDVGIAEDGRTIVERQR